MAKNVLLTDPKNGEELYPYTTAAGVLFKDSTLVAELNTYAKRDQLNADSITYSGDQSVKDAVDGAVDTMTNLQQRVQQNSDAIGNLTDLGSANFLGMFATESEMAAAVSQSGLASCWGLVGTDMSAMRVYSKNNGGSLTEMSTVNLSDFSGVREALGGKKLVVLTEEEYGRLGAFEGNTLYFCTEN